MRASSSSLADASAAALPPPLLPFDSLGAEFDRIYTGIVLDLPGLVAATALAGKHVPVQPPPPALPTPTGAAGGGDATSNIAVDSAVSAATGAGALRLLAASGGPAPPPAADDRDAELLHAALLRQAGRRLEREAAPSLAVGHALLAALSDVLTDASVVALVREAVTARLFPDRAVAPTAGVATVAAAAAPAATPAPA